MFKGVNVPKIKKSKNPIQSKVSGDRYAITKYTHKTLDCESPNLCEDIEQLSQMPFSDFRTLEYKNRNCGSLNHGDTIAFQYFAYTFGGAEKITYANLLLFSEMGYRVILYTDEPQTPQDQPLPKGVLRKQIPTPDALEQRISFWQQEVKSEKIKVIIYSSWLSEIALIDAMALQSAGAFFIYHTHGNAPFFMQMQNANLPALFSRLGNISDSVIVLTESDVCFWQALAKKVFLLANPVEVYLKDQPIVPINKNTKNIVWSGRIDAFDKQVFELAYIMKEVVKDLPEAKLTIVGCGTREEDLKQLVKELLLSANIEFVGYQENVFPYYQQANLMLITSLAEGFSLTIAEAMQQGRPVVAYELPYQTLFRGAGSVQVPQGNRQAAAKEIVKILNDVQLQEYLGHEARKTYVEVCKKGLIKRRERMLAQTVSNPQNNCKDAPKTVFKDLIDAFLFQYAKLIERQAENQTDLCKQLAAKDKKILQLESEICCIKNSKSFKVGLALSALPRKLKTKINAI